MTPEEHYQHLLSLSQTDGALSSQSSFATVNQSQLFQRTASGYRPTGKRQSLHDGILRRFLSVQEVLRYDRRAIVMAGPPGAGKSSTMIKAISDMGRSANQYAVIDPDVFKRELLSAMVADGSIKDLVPPELEAQSALTGETFLPFDFAALVHVESTILADRALKQALQQGANVVIDGTLSDLNQGRQRLTLLAASGYDSQLIVDVEASRRVVERRVRDRWLYDYEHAVSSGTKYFGLGGRLVPSGAFDWIFGEDGVSRPLKTARALETEFRDSVRLVVYLSSESGAPELEYDSAAGGAVIHNETGRRPYAVCTVCHRRLYNPESMALGMGRSCASLVASV
jgi:hypothetical protein